MHLYTKPVSELKDGHSGQKSSTAPSKLAKPDPDQERDGGQRGRDLQGRRLHRGPVRSCDFKPMSILLKLNVKNDRSPVVSNPIFV